MLSVAFLGPQNETKLLAAGADSAPLDLLAWFKEAYNKAPTSKGNGREGKEGGGSPKTLVPPLLDRGKPGGPRTLVCGGGAQFEVTPLLSQAMSSEL